MGNTNTTSKSNKMWREKQKYYDKIASEIEPQEESIEESKRGTSSFK
jgi:hypothetical protein